MTITPKEQKRIDKIAERCATTYERNAHPEVKQAAINVLKSNIVEAITEALAPVVKERDAWKHSAEQTGLARDTFVQELDQLRADNERFREVLNSIANCGQSKLADHWEFRCWARDLACRSIDHTTTKETTK